jgi:hypothetical protein
LYNSKWFWRTQGRDFWQPGLRERKSLKQILLSGHNWEIKGRAETLADLIFPNSSLMSEQLFEQGAPLIFSILVLALSKLLFGPQQKRADLASIEIAVFCCSLTRIQLKVLPNGATERQKDSFSWVLPLTTLTLSSLFLDHQHQQQQNRFLFPRNAEHEGRLQKN